MLIRDSNERCSVTCSCLRQTARAIDHEYLFGSYLVVVLTALYSIFLAWEVLLCKGYLCLYHLDER